MFGDPPLKPKRQYRYGTGTFLTKAGLVWLPISRNLAPPTGAAAGEFLAGRWIELLGDETASRPLFDNTSLDRGVLVTGGGVGPRSSSSDWLQQND
jgi:hypothetical protein